MKKRIIGLPSGSLLQPTIDLLKRIGVEVRINGRAFLAEVKGSKLFKGAFIARPDRLPRLVAIGKIDAAITGLDFLVEKGFKGKVFEVVELNYSKNLRQPARIVIFSKRKKIIDQLWISVLSEYPLLTRKIFKKSFIEISSGTTEADVALGLYDYGVGVVDSGRSLLDNGLRILETLLVSPAVLIAQESTQEMNFFGEILQGALKSESLRVLKFNANSKSEEKLLRMLPSMESPTVNFLADGNIAIETVVAKNFLSDTIVAIKNAGGKDLIVQEIDVIL